RSYRDRWRSRESAMPEERSAECAPFVLHVASSLKSTAASNLRRARPGLNGAHEEHATFDPGDEASAKASAAIRALRSGPRRRLSKPRPAPFTDTPLGRAARAVQGTPRERPDGDDRPRETRPR